MTPTRRRFIGMTAAAAILSAGRAWAGAPQEWRGRALGAEVVLRAEGAAPAQARAFFRAAERALHQVEAQFSLHRDSELTRLNRDGRLSRPSDGFAALLRLAGAVHDATGGAFDPTVQPLWLARAKGLPEPAPGPGWQGVAIAADEVRLRPGMALTLNGIAQGWAADWLAQVARRHDLPHVLIDAGEVMAIGEWQAGVADTQGRLVRRLTLTDRALATSSGRGTLVGPQGDLPHIIDPAGRRAPRDLVSVIAPGAALADGLSTAFCVMDRAAIDRARAAFSGVAVVTLSA